MDIPIDTDTYSFCNKINSWLKSKNLSALLITDHIYRIPKIRTATFLGIPDNRADKKISDEETFPVIVITGDQSQNIASSIELVRDYAAPETTVVHILPVITDPDDPVPQDIIDTYTQHVFAFYKNAGLYPRNLRVFEVTRTVFRKLYGNRKNSVLCAIALSIS